MRTNTTKAKVMILSFLALCLGFVSCYDDTALLERIEALETTKKSSIIQFEDINVKAICLNWDTDFDGELSYEEAAQVDTLEDKFNNTTIGIFKELRYFTKLTSLNGAFKGCSQLVYIDIPSNVTSLGSNTFNGCQSLRRITLPEGVTSIGERAFRGCSSLTAITIPEGVTSIASSAFGGCSRLPTITIPEGEMSIGNEAV